MKYLVTGETIETGRKVSPEEFAHVLERGIVLSLEAFNNLGFKHRIVQKDTDKTRTGVAILHGESPKDINRLLEKFPSWLKVNWSVTPLEAI